MPTATVNVKYVNEPAKNPDYGSIKDAAGEYWSVPKAMLSQFAPNNSYEVEYGTTARGGKTYKNITKLIVGAIKTAPAGTPFREDPKKSEDIAVLSIVKGWMDRIEVGDTAALEHALRSARLAWKRTSTGQQPDAEMNDEIGF